MEIVRVKRLKTIRASVISLLKRRCYRWINAIGPISVNAATSITKIVETARVADRNKAYQERQTRIAGSAGMRKIAEQMMKPTKPSRFRYMTTVTTRTWGIRLV
ncbi:MAG: hypothetical protein OER22_07925 [Gammaproteobacteria bacterium]|nr:hypothetical protein [Gammaproteobacteria bacterium]MDH3372689.1 hypothetical protein [Gammaproteobacteria bacterium]MDH3552528.1 hypothetical protein [Gammaproteobacteria bacterium]